MSTSRSFAARLTWLMTALTAAALVLVTVAHVTLEFRRVRGRAVESVSATARVLAADLAAALDFDDPKAATDTLGTLGAVEEYVRAEVSRASDHGAPFAVFEREPASGAGSLGTDVRTGIEGRWLRIVQPVVRDDEQTGELRLLYDFGPLRRRLLIDVAVTVGVALVLMGLAYAGARAVQRALLRPVRELSDAAAALAAREDYSIRARKVSEDELGSLTDVFNTMVERLGEAEALRRNHREMLEQEVTRRTREALEAQARLRQSERMASLGTLSAGLGHDIGNLLMPLRAHLHSIRARVNAREDDPDFAAISRASEYLQNLSTSLRMLAQDPARIVEGSPTELRGWWREMEPILRPMLGRGILLEGVVPEGLPAVRLSKPLLMQAVFNLVQNAGQALAPEGSPIMPRASIRVEARAIGEVIELSVADNGPGMDQVVQQRCLEPYFTTKTRRISSGLGLPLVKGIVEGVGGELKLESKIGEGSRFTLVLPVAEAVKVERTRAVVTVREPRRRALISHVLTGLNCAVDAPAAAGVDHGLWVTDVLGEVPAEWTGSVVLLGQPPENTRGGGRITVVDPATPLPELRVRLQSVLQGVNA
ncbi:MAG TPA: ATP-binding protein [Phycisphaerales bacterium]|nr:ATP-binding protein [Phycisphaerales bacterium]